MALRSPILLHQRRGHVISTQPAAEPVSAAELVAHLRTDSTELPDAEADDLIQEAREWIENHIGVAMINQSWRLVLDQWPGGREQWWDGVREGAIGDIFVTGSARDVELPRYPLQSVTTVRTFTEDGTETSLTVADFFDVDVYSAPGRMTLKSGKAWPTAIRANNAIEVIYLAGYGADGTTVPATIKRAVRALASALYENRGDACKIEDLMTSSGAAALLGAYKPQKI